MSNWDILGGNDDGNDNEEEVEYVGVIEEDVPAVQEPTRAPRKNVRRVAPRRMPTDQTFYPVAQNKRHQNGVVGSPNRDQEDLVSYVNMPHGKQLGLTPEAVDRLQTTPMTELNGQMSQRIEPGTYVMYGPSRADKMGMGTNGDPWSTEGLPGFQTADAASSAAYESQTSGGTGWLGDLFGAVATLGSGIATAVAGSQASRREARVERLRIAAEQEAAQSAREAAFQQAQLEHEENLARIEAGAEELEALRAQAEEAAALRRQAGSQPPVVGNTRGGGSPVVWIVAGLLGLGAVGGVIYFVTRKKNKDEDED